MTGERWLQALCAVAILWIAGGLYMKHRPRPAVADAAIATWSAPR